MAAESFVLLHLKDRLRDLIQEKRKRISRLRDESGDTVVAKVTVEQLLGGARDIRSLVYETSLLDKEGILLRGWSVFELREKLPKVFLHFFRLSVIFWNFSNDFATDGK